MNIILGTSSKLRQQAMPSLGILFKVIPSHFDEESIAAEEIDAMLTAIAKGKADTLVRAYPDSLIITADSNNFFEGKSYGKPKSLMQAKEWLRQMRGKTEEFHTALVVSFAAAKKQTVDLNVSYITFKNFSDNELENYLAQVNPLKMAIDWSVQGSGSDLLAEFKGEPASEYALPLNTLKKRLGKFSVVVNA
jgi:septum formation protein